MFLLDEKFGKKMALVGLYCRFRTSDSGATRGVLIDNCCYPSIVCSKISRFCAFVPNHCADRGDGTDLIESNSFSLLRNVTSNIVSNT